MNTERIKILTQMHQISNCKDSRWRVGKWYLLLTMLMFAGSGCLPGMGDESRRFMDAAMERQRMDDNVAAINLYERALDGSGSTAKAHFRLGLLYLDRVDQPVAAAHHFERYLSFQPQGAYAAEAREYRERAERQILARSGELGYLTREEAARLRNENFALRRQLAVRTGGQAGEQASLFDRVSIYTVEAGDTLAEIARKVYGNQGAWRAIEEANRSRVPDARQLQPGTILIIPPL